jgi:hypothetical protein
MKTLKLGICMMDEEGNVISKKQIGSDWSVDLSQEPRPQHDVFVAKNRATTDMLTQALKAQLKRIHVSEVLDDVRAKCE